MKVENVVLAVLYVVMLASFVTQGFLSESPNMLVLVVGFISILAIVVMENPKK